MLGVAPAGDNGHPLGDRAGGAAGDPGDLLGGLGPAGHTEVALGLTCGHRLGVLIAAGIAAGAAVGPRQGLADALHRLAGLDLHDFGEGHQDDGGGQPQAGDHHDPVEQDIHSLSPPYLNMFSARPAKPMKDRETSEAATRVMGSP